MKVYISGDNTSHPKDIKTRFEDAENYLRNISHTPINPLNCSTLASRIEILSTCDAIFLLSGWLNSCEAKIEKHVADLTGKVILFESRIEIENREDLIMFPIKGAIQEVTGYSFEEYASDDRLPGKRLHKCKPIGYFCRMIFSIQCQRAGIEPQRIPRYIPRDYTSILHYLRKYDSEYTYNKEFREMADRVNDILHPCLVKA